MFTISGGIGIVWYVLWAIFTSNTPEQHRWITEEEKTYIITSVEKEKSKNVITVSFLQLSQPLFVQPGSYRTFLFESTTPMLKK